jgi:hypothetical protein
MVLGMRAVNVALSTAVCDERVVPDPNPLTVDSCTTYCVCPDAGLVPFDHATVIDVKLTEVQVLATVTGMVAKVAVVMLVVHELELPLIIEFTRP